MTKYENKLEERIKELEEALDRTLEENEEVWSFLDDAKEGICNLSLQVHEYVAIILQHLKEGQPDEETFSNLLKNIKKELLNDAHMQPDDVCLNGSSDLWNQTMRKNLDKFHYNKNRRT